MSALRTLLFSTLLAPAALAQTWSVQPTPTNVDLSNVFARSATEVYAVGDAGVLLRTTDGGQTWNLIDLGNADLEGVAFSPDRTVGIIATDNGPVRRSTDGVNWALIQTGSGDNLRDVSWGSDTAVWSVGREGDGLRSTDAGLTWSVSNIPNTNQLRAISAVSATDAWVVGEGGQVFVTTNGATWTPQNSGTNADLHDVQMLNATTGYIVVSNNTVRKTTNGGATWVNVSNGNAGGDGLFFLNEDIGWLADDNGRIWFTNNGGGNWELQPSGTNTSLSGIHFADATHGWAVGDNGVITAFTVDGGITLAANAEPVSPPVVIPGGGGVFQFTATITNTSPSTQTFQAWTSVTGPASREPVLGPLSITLPPGGSVTRTLTQVVPGAAPAGTYTYAVNAGTFPGLVVASDGFPVVKEGAVLTGGGTPGAVAGWEAGGWEGLGDPEVASGGAGPPTPLALGAVYPNPARGHVRVTLAIPATQAVRVEVYDALGRRVATLHDGLLAEGTHGLALDAASLPAGTYVVRATGEAFSATRRIVLVH